MVCSKCGTKISNGGKFCPKCGEPVPAVSDEIKISSSEKGQKQDSGTLQNKQNGMKHLFSKHPKLIFSALAVVMVAVLFVIFKYMALVPILILLVLFAGIMINRRILRKIKEKDSQEIAQCALADNEINKLAQYFVNRDEKYISSLGNGYIMNYLASGSLSRGFAVISNKRVYFRGSCFSGQGKSLVKTDEERTVDIKDVTGSGFIYRRYIGVLLGLFVALAVLLSGIAGSTAFLADRWDAAEECQAYAEEFQAYAERCQAEAERCQAEAERCQADAERYQAKAESWQAEAERCQIYTKRSFSVASLAAIVAGLLITFLISCFLVFLNYLKKRKTMFQIQYAGGCIAFDVSYYAKAEMDDFQKQLRRAKDLAEKSTAKITVSESPVQPSTQNSVPDDLRKYADLLKEGLISQEEYDAMKKKILNL